MEKMLKKIILADRKAQETVDKAEEQRRNTEERILQAKEQLEKKFQDEALKETENFRAEKEKMLSEENEKIKEKTALQMAELDDSYNKNKEIWIKTITDKVISNA